MKFQMNFTTSDDDTTRYTSATDLRGFYQKYGCSGLELMPIPGWKDGSLTKPEDCPLVTADMVTGVHACCIGDWMDKDRESLLAHYRKDLDYATRMGAEYVVFHVTQVTDEEAFTWQMRHTDEEVVDAASQFINELLNERKDSFWFLMENLWWPGLTFRSPDVTRRLLDGVHYEKKGLILDTGHYMHTNLRLRSQAEALHELNRMLDDHGELVSYIKGIHLQQSLTGEYIQNWLKNPPPLPDDPDERFCKVFEHIFAIDRHLPFTGPGVREMVERIDPLYLTYEYISHSREEHAQMLQEGSSVFY